MEMPPSTRRKRPRPSVASASLDASNGAPPPPPPPPASGTAECSAAGALSSFRTSSSAVDYGADGGNNGNVEESSSPSDVLASSSALGDGDGCVGVGGGGGENNGRKEPSDEGAGARNKNKRKKKTGGGERGPSSTAAAAASRKRPRRRFRLEANDDDEEGKVRVGEDVPDGEDDDDDGRRRPPRRRTARGATADDGADCDREKDGGGGIESSSSSAAVAKATKKVGERRRAGTRPAADGRIGERKANEEKKDEEKKDDDDDNDPGCEVQLVGVTTMDKGKSDGDGNGGMENSDDNDDPPPIVPAGSLPSYLADAFGDLLEEDGLAVLGRGLGWLGLLAAFVRFYADAEEGYAAMLSNEAEDEGVDEARGKKKSESTSSSSSSSPRQPRRPPLVFVLGLRDSDRQTLLSTLTSWGTPPDILPTEITNESGQAKDRSLMYRRGGVFLVTSRILIVDLLTGAARPGDIEGMLVARAENVNENSTEAFILRIYRTQKRWATSHRSSSDRPPGALAANSGDGFVKAFSDNPDSLMAGFAKVDKILKALHVRRLYLYPRFRECVSTELERTPPVVTELHQQLTPKMKEIQNAIAAAVQTCIRELKKSTPLIQWTESDLTLENCVTTNFELRISRQLEHDWHRLKPQTKQMVHDLRTLRALFSYLIQYDAVAFWRLINSVRTMSAAARNPSLWLLTPAADLLFRRAKERLYRIERPRKTKDVPEPVARLRPVLEENPKWRLLREVLTEVRNDWRERKEGEKSKPKGTHSSSAPPRDQLVGGAQVLVIVKDEKTLDAVRSYLVDGRERAMTVRWLRYLESHNDRSRTAVARSAAANSAAANGGSNNGGGGAAAAALSEEGRLLLEEEGRARNFLFGPKTPPQKKKRRPGPVAGKKRKAAAKGAKAAKTNAVAKAKTAKKANAKATTLGAVPEWKRRRRRVAREMGRGERTMQPDDLERRAVLDEALEETELGMMAEEDEDKDKEEVAAAADDDDAGDGDGAEGGKDGVSGAVGNEASENDDVNSIDGSGGSSSSEDEEEIPYKVRRFNDDTDLRVTIRTHSNVEGDQALTVLGDTKPDYVVLYDAEPSFVRSLEIYAATTYADDAAGGGKEEAKSSPDDDDSSRSHRLRVFFMLFEASSEEKNFLRAIEREQNAFERLIRHKKTMPLPVIAAGGTTQEMQAAMGGAGGSYMGGALPLSVDTRTGRGRKKVDKERRDIAVDVREFRSALPNVLHQGGMRLAPVTLTVGDFVLSNVHCVERKSVGDLFGSFASGRLYTQAESMSKHYSVPCLLIEFDPAKSFTLQNSNELGADVRTDSACSKMALLTMHFPRLRVLWSRGPHETLRIFKALKANHEEVDVDKAVEKGSNESLDALLGDGGGPTVDEDGDGEVDEVNEAARDMLLRLPGVNVHNARKIMSACDSVAELADMSRDELKGLLGPLTGQKLFTFFRQKLAST